MRTAWPCALALCALLRPSLAEVKKPPLPPGRDPGGVAIALLTTGVDYTDQEVAARLARDGEGELIGWDVADADNRPYAARGGSPNWGGDGTLLARALGGPGRRLVAVRIRPADPSSLAHAIAFIAATPARIVVVPMWSSVKADWEPFQQAALHYGDLLLIAAAGDEGKDIDREPVWPAAFHLDNMLVVTAPLAAANGADRAPNGGARLVDAVVAGGTGRSPPANTSLAAMLAADALVGCWPGLVAAYRGKALKAALLAEAVKTKGGPKGADKPIIAGCAPGASP